VNSLFCRHNRFTADCPICSKGTVLDSERGGGREPRRGAAGVGSRASRRSKPAAGPRFTGPYVSTGPYRRDDGESYDVRLERVPGGVRLAEWSGGQLARRAPLVGAADLPALVESAREREVLGEDDAETLREALATAGSEPPTGEPPFGSSPARSGDMQEELRIEPAGEGRVRIARWMLRPGSGWQLQDAPVMLPVKRYAEALRSATRRGVLRPVSGAGDAARP
jgi:hypothetical protein